MIFQWETPNGSIHRLDLDKVTYAFESPHGDTDRRALRVTMETGDKVHVPWYAREKFLAAWLGRKLGVPLQRPPEREGGE